MTTTLLWVFLPLVIAFAFGALSWWIENRNGPNRRGTEPGQGYTVIGSSYGTGDDGGGSGGATIHPKDPQAHARAFSPDSEPKH